MANKRNGLPDQLKSGIENLSGMSLDEVRVHYNSPLPGQQNSHANTQGTDIHLGSGQQRDLQHETWHVVQQAQGRVSDAARSQIGLNSELDRSESSGIDGRASSKS